MIVFNPPIMPNMNPIMKPPPIITVGIEKTIATAPQAFLFADIIDIKELSKTTEPQINPIATRVLNEMSALFVPGIVGINVGNHVVTTPKRTALAKISTPAIKENLEAFVVLLTLTFLPQSIVWY